MHRQFAAGAQGVAIDGSNQGLGELGNGLPVHLTRIVEHAHQVASGHFIEVGACGKGLAAAGQDHGANAVVAGAALQLFGELGQQFTGQCIECLWALQGDQANRLVGVHGKGMRHGEGLAGRSGVKAGIFIGRAGAVSSKYRHEAIRKYNTKNNNACLIVCGSMPVVSPNPINSGGL
ncbi:hypothetical protein D3C77_594110 [compost metagenome]